MKKITIITVLTGAFALMAQVYGGTEPVRQDALEGVANSETLVAGAAAVVDENLIIEIMGSEKPSPWLHTFIDLDGDKKTGFNHYLGGPAGQGLDLMIEGDILYRFSGDDSSVWSWTPMSSVTVSKDYDADVFILKLPASVLELEQAPTVFAVVYSVDYAEAVDCLPRNGGVWRVSDGSKISGLFNSTSSASATVSMAADSVEKKTSLITRGPINRREAFDSIESYVCYYGSGQVEAMSRRDAAIIETKNQTPESIARLQAANTLVIGYISIGEDDDLRVGDASGFGGYDSSYFDRNGDGLPDKNPIWSSYYADAREPAWRRYFLDRAYAMREQYGVDGFFLDTVDTSELYKESETAMKSLIRELRAQNPESIIVLNRGFHTVEDLAPVVDGVMFESFTASYDFENKNYTMMRPSAWDWGLEVYENILKPAMDQFGLVVLVLDYVSSEDAPEIKVSYDRAVSFGYVPEVSTIFLDAIYDVSYRGKADPKYLEIQSTPEVMSYVLPGARNGFPEKTTVIPSSVYSDYAVAPVVDGVADKETLNWRNRAWASRDRAVTHSLEFSLPHPVAAKEMRIQWAFDNGQYYSARQFRVEIKKEDTGAWEAVEEFGSNQAASNVVRLSGSEIASVRIVQEPGDGALERPNIMWIEQVELVQ